MTKRTDNCKRDILTDEKRPVKIKHRILNNVFPFGNRVTLLLRVLEAWMKTSNWPGGGMLPLVKPKNNWFVNMPVNLEMNAEGEELPPDVLYKLIDESKYIHILDRCLCRHGEDCQNHRHDIGCMFLGASGLDVVPQFSHKATKEEAYAHVKAGLEDGLMPMAGRIRVDNYAFVLPDHRTLIGVCMCCDCCCFMSYYKHVPKKMNDQIYHMISGAKLKIDPSKCTDCTSQECVEHCYMENITYGEGKVIFADKCKLCGRCSRFCPNDAIRFYTEDAQCLDKLTEEMFGLADLKGQGTGKKPLPY